MNPTPEQQQQESKKLIIAIAVSALVLLAFDYFTRPSEAELEAMRAQQIAAQQQALQTQQFQQAQQQNQLQPPPALPNNGIINSQTALPGAPQQLAQATATTMANAPQTVRINLQSDVLQGSIALVGGRVDELSMPMFKTEQYGDENITLFRPNGIATDNKNAHFFDAGWQSSTNVVPDGNTAWQAVTDELQPNKPLVLRWDNGAGLSFERKFSIDLASYSIKVIDSVTNNSNLPVSLGHYAQLHKEGIPGNGSMYDPEASTFYNFLGPMAFMDEVKTEVDYEDLMTQAVTLKGQKGWLGITSQYFMAAIIPDQISENTVRFKHSKLADKDFFSAILQSPSINVAAGQKLENHYRLYAGPKIISELEKENVQLEEAVDYGWFHIIARPIFDMILWFNSYVGNLGIAIILGTIVLKILLFPLANKSYRAMALMKKIQPRMEKLKEACGDDRQKFAMEMMALYKAHKVNPASGCWPMLIQIPIFFAFYKVILISFDFRHAEFIGWIHNLSDKDPFFVLPVLMGASMWVQQKLSPPMADPIQQKVMKMLPIIFTVMFAMFPAGLVLYWLTNNVISVGQQWWMTKKYA